MFSRALHRQIAKLESRFGYDATYMHEILDVDSRAFWKFGLAQWMFAHRTGLPPDAYYAARIAAARHEDCGPCTQLVVNMALAEKVTPEIVRAIVARDFAQLSSDAALGLRMAEATLMQEEHDELRAEAVRRFGKNGLIALAYAIATARVYPSLKRTLGYAHTCERVLVAGETVTAAKAGTQIAA